MTPALRMAAFAQPHRYRVARDAEGWPLIPGRYGRLEYHDGRALSTATARGCSPGSAEVVKSDETVGIGNL
jgi:hypothetical protein